MKRKFIMTGVLCMWAVLTVAQTTPETVTTSPNSAATNPIVKPQADASGFVQHASHSAIPARLSKSVDSKKVKPGDPIEARTTASLISGNGVQVPEGTKIVGHIEQAKAKSKGDPESELGFSFEKIVLKNGKEIPFPSVAQAIGAQIAPSQSAAGYPEDSGPTMPPASGAAGIAGPQSAVASTAGTTPDAASPGPSTNMRAEGLSASNQSLSENATGVVGIKDLTLSSQASQSTVSSNSKSVKLEQGTQLLLRYSGQ